VLSILGIPDLGKFTMIFRYTGASAKGFHGRDRIGDVVFSQLDEGQELTPEEATVVLLARIENHLERMAK